MMIYLTEGLVLGMSAGLAPGPLLALIVSQSIRYGLKEGIKIALAPLLTDLPIILLTILALTKLSNFQPILGLISILGGVFLLYLAYESFSITKLNVYMQDVAPQSLKKGVLVNILSPHPYLFWFTVGAPIIIKAMEVGHLEAAAFVLSFYSLLIGSKIIIALLAGKTQKLLEGKAYTYIIRSLGVILFFFSLLLFRDGVVFLGY